MGAARQFLAPAGEKQLSALIVGIDKVPVGVAVDCLHV
jgi:hypothetical protein